MSEGLRFCFFPKPSPKSCHDPRPVFSEHASFRLQYPSRVIPHIIGLVCTGIKVAGGVEAGAADCEFKVYRV